jgi:hypothetical protein
MRCIRPRNATCAAVVVLIALACTTCFTAFAASNSASATLRVSIVVIPTVNNAVAEPQNTDSAINFLGFGTSGVAYSVEIRPLPPQFIREIPLKTNDLRANPASAVLQTTTVVPQ